MIIRDKDLNGRKTAERVPIIIFARPVIILFHEISLFFA